MTILELAHQIGLTPKWVAGTSGGEYHSPCPICGGTDRFYIQPYRQMSRCVGSYCCRQCQIYGDSIQFARQFLNYDYREAVQAVHAFIPDNIMQPPFDWSPIFKPATLQKPPVQWVQRATRLVFQAHQLLLTKSDVLLDLSKRGLPLEAVIRYKLGWSNSDQFFSKVSWGLIESGEKRKIWIPEGIVIPTVEANADVIRLKIRRRSWSPSDTSPKYVAISGSMNGMSLVGSMKQTIVIVVESELDAYAIHYTAGDFVCAVAVGSNIKNPDNVIDRLARNAKHLLICHDNDAAGEKMLIKWRKFYPQAVKYPTPIGKDIGEAIQNGLDIKEWLSQIRHP